MNLKPFFSYYGGKYRLAPKYPKPKYGTIIEPFAGSAGYSVRYPHCEVILNDINPIIYGVWNYLINARESEILSLPDNVVNTDSLKECQEIKWLIGFWINSASVAPGKAISSWFANRDKSQLYWSNAVKWRLANQLKYIRHWKIKNEHYEYLPNVEATWFVDPPYDSKAGRQYPYSDINYSDLAYHCKNWRGQVIVCEQDGADWMPFRFFQETKTNPGPKGKGFSKETIWTNIDLFD